MKQYAMRKAVLLVVGALAMALVPMQAQAAENGTVTATVTADAPCITLSATSVAFGSAQFSSPTTRVTKAGPVATQVTNCSSSSENIYARGSDAANGTATWALMGSASYVCNTDVNKYKYRLKQGTLPNNELTTTDQLMSSMSAGGAQTKTHEIEMPCQGSSGGGQQMTMAVTFTATF